MSEHREVEKALAAKEARDTAAAARERVGRSHDVRSALMRYLAAEQYYEKAPETGEADSSGGES